MTAAVEMRLTQLVAACRTRSEASRVRLSGGMLALPSPEPFYVQLVCSLRVCVGSLRELRLLPTAPKRKYEVNWKREIVRMCVCECECLFVFVCLDVARDELATCPGCHSALSSFPAFNYP